MRDVIARFEALDTLVIPSSIDAKILTLHERERCNALKNPADQTAFEAAHLLVRMCAAQLLGIEASDIVIEQRCGTCGEIGHGRPSVIGQDIFVSIAHTREHVAAVAARTACGIDVESRSESIVERALSPRELAWVHAHSNPHHAFTLLWVRKESIVKAGKADLSEIAQIELVDKYNELVSEYDSLLLTEFTLAPRVVGCTAVASRGIKA